MIGNDGPQPTNGTDPVYLNTLTLDGAGSGVSVTAGSIDGEPCDATNTPPTTGAYGIKDVETGSGGTVCFCLTETGGVNEWVILEAGGDGYGLNYTRSNIHGNARTLAALPPYGIELSLTGTHPFVGDSYGYVAPPTAHLLLRSPTPRFLP
jgi:hypothetical protein